METTPSRIPVDRPLSAEEHSLIRWLLRHGDGDNAAFVEQLNQANVVAHCACGCASVDLAISGECGTGGMRVLADFQWTTPEGHACGAFVYEQGGLLAGLDLWSIDGGTVPSSLPRTDDLVPFGSPIVSR
ncbi:hypothetical protein [Lysobacter arvi]|uniref:Uncharacterized protein n=1 Tax=Lysobacter arvi TaxID=3038776 RepID=A0ABU1CGQ1_9GAMM|nr:hypothetical protein [Lysobacter arvi]MDR0184097.1 hypothetical protein [Lysobacter arvi]